MTSWNSLTREVVAGALVNGVVINGPPGASGAATNDSAVSVGAESKIQTPSTLVSSMVYDRNWENDMESLLKVRHSHPFALFLRAG